MQRRFIAPPAFLALLGLVSSSGACAGAAEGTAKPADTLPATATASGAPAPSGTASASVEPPRAPEVAPGRERVQIALLAGTDEAIGATLDIPATWSIRPNKHLGPSFQSCSGATAVLGASLSVSADPCEKGEPAATCVDRLLAAKQARWGADAALADPEKPALRRWAEIQIPGKNGRPAGREGLLYTYDPAHHAAAVCRYLDMAGSDPDWPAAKATCATLALTSTPPTAELAARDPKPDGAPGNAASTPHGDEMASVVLAFHAAVVAGDAKAAKKHLVGPELCDTLGAAKDRPRCKADVQASAAAFDKALPELRKSAEGLDPAGVQLLPMSGSKDMYLGYPIDKKTPCAMPMTLAWPVVWSAGGAKILVAAKKADGPKKK